MSGTEEMDLAREAAGDGDIVFDWQSRERLLLGSYATWASGPAIRRHSDEPLHAYRSPFQRDRDRIVHSAAFRRLSGKMQVFTGDMGDYHRTRLTHTQEVASIARTIGRVLRLNEDLIEALALLHDVGHPPYGHCGEDALDAALAAEGGFSHNRFALQLVCEIERRAGTSPGLNLTAAVLAGQEQRIDKSRGEVVSLEVQVVDVADSIAYNAHDVDDALQLGLLQLPSLMSLDFVRRSLLEQQVDPQRIDRRVLVHALVETQVHHFLRHAQGVLATAEPTAQSDDAARPRLDMPADIEGERNQLSGYLFDHVYRHEKLIDIRQRAARRLSQLFYLLQAYPQRLPPRFTALIDRLGTSRTVGVYLAGMTDRFCDEVYLQLIEMGRDHAPDWEA